MDQHSPRQLEEAFAGTFHGLNYAKYAAGYLGAFAYRFNRRFGLRRLVARYVVDVARYTPVTRITVKRGMLRLFSNQERNWLLAVAVQRCVAQMEELR